MSAVDGQKKLILPNFFNFPKKDKYLSQSVDFLDHLLKNVTKQE